MPSVASVEGKCLLISVLFVNISQVLTRIRTIAKNVEYAGRLTQKIFFSWKVYEYNIYAKSSTRVLEINVGDKN